VDLEVFTALEANLNPETGEKLTPRTNKTRKEWWFNQETGKREIREVDDRRSGMDLPMIVPKTVSEVWADVDILSVQLIQSPSPHDAAA
jgi:hypothetical protein